MNTDYKFPVEFQPIKTEQGLSIPSKFALVRSDTKDVLSVVTDKYKLLKHEDVIDSFRNALHGIGADEKIVLKTNGAQLFATYKLNEEFEVAKNDKLNMQFIVRNSYNYTSSLQIILGAFRLVCSNGMIVGKQFISFSQRHIGENTLIDKKVLGETIDKLTLDFKSSLPQISKMIKTSLKTAPKALFNPKTIRIPSYLLEEAELKYSGEDRSVWGFYNALTWAITHKMSEENALQKVEYGRVAYAVAQSKI